MKILAVLAALILGISGGAADEIDDHDITYVLPAEFSETVFPAGATIWITLNWEAKRPMQSRCWVYMSVINSDRRVVDYQVHDPEIPANSPGWNGKISYRKKFTVQKGLSSGKYTLNVGLLQLHTMEDGTTRKYRVRHLLGPNPPKRRLTGKYETYKAGEFTIDPQAPMPPKDTEREPTLNLKDFELVFAEDFTDGLSVSRSGLGTRWRSHIPEGGNYGDARFCDSNPGETDFLEEKFPFTVVKTVDDPREGKGEYKTSGGILRIEMRKNAAWAAKDLGKRPWASGFLAGSEAKKLQYGYFEARMKMPAGPGVWPAFRLCSQYTPALKEGKTPGETGAMEINAVEYYGINPGAYQTSQHVRRPEANLGRAASIQTKANEAAEDFHNYGVMVMPDFITYYFDGVEVWKTATPEEHNKPLMMLVSLAAGNGWPTDKMISPSFLYVDYIRAYQKKGTPAK